MTEHESKPVEATITPTAAAAIHWQAIVIGAGPGGSAAATRLAAGGLSVLVIDATTMPRPKVCGACLSPAGVRELAALARLAGDPAALPPGAVPLERVHLATAAVAATVPLAGGAVVSREALDSAGVRRAIAAGAAWLPATRVARIEPGSGGHCVVVSLSPAASGSGGDCLTGAIVVVATGLADTIRLSSDANDAAPSSRIGMGTTLPAGAGGPPPGELVMAVSRGGYCGIVRLEDGRIDIAAALDRGLIAQTGSPARAVASILEETMFLAESGGGIFPGDPPGRIVLDSKLLGAATWRGTPPLTRSQPVADATGRILRIGDAAGYVEPFTGEGMGWALASARLLVEAVGAAVANPAPGKYALTAAAARYAVAHRRHFARHHARCRRVAIAVRRPWIVGGAARLARFAPGIAARMTPLVVGAAGIKEIR